MPITPSVKMKQLQWDKLPHQQVSNTLWGSEQLDKENEMLQKLQLDGVWRQMEEDFKAKQLMINLMARQKRAELKSVLDDQTKKHVEILMKRVKKLAPEEIAWKIKHFDAELCTRDFLKELKLVLPTPEQIGKLNVYRNSEIEELAELHPADRLMVKLIQIERLVPRIEAMAYKSSFDETLSLLDTGAHKLIEAGQSLLEAKAFKELLSLILLVGNYMNGTGVKGGAFGFKVSSINKLVDTKSVNNTTLLHFLEKTVVKHFPDMETFLEELSKPADACRENLQDIRKGLGELREGLKRIRQELKDHFTDMDPEETYGRQMWSFVGKAGTQLDDLADDVNAAETTFVQVVKHYGEDEKNMTSTEFYAIFKTFVTSYKKCKADNQLAVAEQLAIEKRKQAAQEMKAIRDKAQAEKPPPNPEDANLLDGLLERLLKGDSVGRKARRTRPTVSQIRQEAPTLSVDALSSGLGDTAGMALDMLAQLQSEGFMRAPPTPAPPRRSRRRINDVETLEEVEEPPPKTPTGEDPPLSDSGLS